MSDFINFKYRAFLSYSHADTPLAKWLHSRFESFPLRGLSGRETALGLVPKQLRPIFRDREDFSAGGSLNDQSIAALDASAALIVLCSPASAKSHYVNEEIRLFKHRRADRPALYAHLRPQVRGAVQMIHLTRIDPARNMARFYTMALQPTLFGDWALLKEWGRIGSAGRLVSSRFASKEEAALAMAKHLKTKLRKGYEAV